MVSRRSSQGLMNHVSACDDLGSDSRGQRPGCPETARSHRQFRPASKAGPAGPLDSMLEQLVVRFRETGDLSGGG